MAKVRRARVVPTFTGGICTVHVSDVVNGILAALTKAEPGQRYILGGENITYRSLAERTASVLRLRRIFAPVPPVVTGAAAKLSAPVARIRGRRPRFTPSIHLLAGKALFYDSGKASRTLGYTPRSFDAILQDWVSSGMLDAGGP